MPLKYFGPNRMAAQQEVEDSGSSLVRGRPSWGMGPQGMPGSFDYNPKPTESRRAGQGGQGVREPNMYEQGGFFWTGSGVSQGTPIAHQNQGLDLREQDNARRWAAQALDDKAHGLNVRNVNARIRQADRGFDEGVRVADRSFGLQERGFDEGVRVADRGFNENVRQSDRSFGLQERGFDEGVRVADRGFDEGVRQADRTFGLQEKQDQRAGTVFDERWKKREYEQDIKRDVARRKGLASSNPERFLSIFSNYSRTNNLKDELGNPVSAYLNDYGVMSGKQAVSPQATQFINKVDELAMDPRLQNLPEQELAQLALQQDLRWHGGQLLALTDQGWRPVNLPTARPASAGVR